MAKERKWIDIDLGPARPKASQESSDAAGDSDEDETVDLNKPVLGATRPLRPDPSAQPPEEELPVLGATRPLRQEPDQPLEEELPLLGPTRPLNRSSDASPASSTQETPPPQAADEVADAHPATVPLGVGAKKPGATVSVAPEVFNPVVGWLVCVEGEGRGRAYELQSARNFIGRGADMHVRLAEDSSVSGDKHAIVSYDPRGNAYMLASGANTTEMVYLNDEAVYAPTPLAHGDVIHVGNTRLRFVPFCDDHFSWK